MPRSSRGQERSVDEKITALDGFEEVSALAEQGDDNLPFTKKASNPDTDDVKENRRTMMYTFAPKWPLVGPKTDVLGILGHSKSVSSLVEVFAMESDMVC